MLKIKIFISFLLLSLLTIAQIETTFYCSFDCGKLIKKDSLGNYYQVSSDTTKTVFISNDKSTYKLYNKDNKISVLGDLGNRVYLDYFKRFGKWIEYFDNGKIKNSGYYYEDQAVGLWQQYFENGHLRKTYTISFVSADTIKSYCKTGLYQEFYDNGQLQKYGFYKASIDTVRQYFYDINSGELTTNFKIVKQFVSKPFGLWYFYNHNGELEKVEEYEKLNCH
jgi:antitoxin component YwqK of YwqJK toxin-antitoxin module